MSVVSAQEHTGSTSVSVSVQAGDIVVLVNAARTSGLNVDNVQGPSGWVRVGVWRGGFASGFRAGGPFGVWWRVAPSTGTLTANVPWNNWSATVVLRGPSTIAATHVARQNAQQITYPAVNFGGTPYSGDLVYIGGFHPPHWGNDHHPSGRTLRAEETLQWTGSDGYFQDSYFVVSTGSFTSATSIPAQLAVARTGGYAITLAAADVAGPDAPDIIAPKNGSIDLEAGFDFVIEPSYEPTTGVAWKRKLGAWPEVWWDGTGWNSSTEVIIPGDATTLHVTGDSVDNDGELWVYSAATRGDQHRPELGPYKSVILKAVAAPNAPGMTVSNVSGTTLTSFTPTITLTGGAGGGATLTGYRIALGQEGETFHVEDIADTTPGASWTIPVPVAKQIQNGKQLLVQSWIVQDGTQVGPEAWTILDVAVPTPGTPGVYAARVEHPESGAPGHRVTVAPAAPMTTGTVDVWRVTDTRRDHIHSGPVEDGWVVDDYLAPSVGDVHYEATVTTADTIPVTSAVGASGDVTLPHVCGWVIDPLDPSTAVAAPVAAIAPSSRDLRAHAMAPLGQSGWVVHSGVALDHTGSVTVTVEGDDALARLDALVAQGRRLLLRGWEERGLRDKDARGVSLDLYVHLIGEVTTARPHVGPWSVFEVTLNYVVVDAPEWLS